MIPTRRRRQENLVQEISIEATLASIRTLAEQIHEQAERLQQGPDGFDRTNQTHPERGTSNHG